MKYPKFLFPFFSLKMKKIGNFFQIMTDTWFNHSLYRQWGVLLKNTYYENLHSRGVYFAPQDVISHAPMNTKFLWQLIIDIIKKTFKFHDNKFKTLLIMYNYMNFGHILHVKKSETIKKKKLPCILTKKISDFKRH